MKKNKVSLITSSAYVSDEFISEVGFLPPSFLPIGNKRLYEHQVEMLYQLNDDSDIYITIPKSYFLSKFDCKRLKDIGVSVLRINDGLSLAESVYNAIGDIELIIGDEVNEISILHGDTLLIDVSRFQNSPIYSINKNQGYYKRSVVNFDSSLSEYRWSSVGESVLSGYFHRLPVSNLLKGLESNPLDFTNMLNYVADKTKVSFLENGDWLDFGHINSFFDSRAKMTTQRAFNELQIVGKVVQKFSKDKTGKVIAEGLWFDSIPYPIREYTPQLVFIDVKENFYKLEYLYSLPLSDVYCFCNLNIYTWNRVFNSISMAVNCLHSQKVINRTKLYPLLNDLYGKKTYERLMSVKDISDKSYKSPLGWHGNLFDLANNVLMFINPATNEDVAVSHGDLCFSNILYDFRSSHAKLLDPRGVLPDGTISIYGDRRYDFAKLYHSIVGGYDLIITGQYEVSIDCNEIKFFKTEEEISYIYEAFKREILKSSGYDEKEILSISILLFLSMLPLHYDSVDRQQAFVLNALRLYDILENL